MCIFCVYLHGAMCAERKRGTGVRLLGDQDHEPGSRHRPGRDLHQVPGTRYTNVTANHLPFTADWGPPFSSWFRVVDPDFVAQKFRMMHSFSKLNFFPNYSLGVQFENLGPDQI
jgi:hypothetical protein